MGMTGKKGLCCRKSNDGEEEGGFEGERGTAGDDERNTSWIESKAERNSDTPQVTKAPDSHRFEVLCGPF
jgi:hypothetical protein